MDVDSAQVAAAVMPYVTAYGVTTLDKFREAVVDRTSDATVALGSRLVDLILGRAGSRQAIEGAIADVAAGEEDSEAALRLQIRKALAADPDLARDVAALLPAGAVHIEASGTRSIAIGTNTGIANTGDGAAFHR
ncbi:hypothetical protein GCM10010435_22260 [Winogradskya consettensis]|uniref:Uncharacterized protein n=1 Tax=Winogradskya consettensis TaxID=113560 RepID=A0A919T578_9ACTN|nr:hypothetical protein [Actinoplanes consettensis]GIM85185.1 hypothetical protein Aco04nite_94970 [Actinoplanes consettensis]